MKQSTKVPNNLVNNLCLQLFTKQEKAHILLRAYVPELQQILKTILIIYVQYNQEQKDLEHKLQLNYWLVI